MKNLTVLTVLVAIVSPALLPAQGSNDSGEPRFISFEAPGAAAQGTFAVSINPTGAITGYYFDSNGLAHGYLRARDATFTTFEVPGDVQGTFPSSINSTGAIAGSYKDASCGIHGFLRAPDGTFITFDAPGSASYTSPSSINLDGTVTGFFLDAQHVFHGFLRAPAGTFTTFEAQGAGTVPKSGTLPQSINPAGAIAGYYFDSSIKVHAFLRSPDGAFTTFDPPGSIATYGMSIDPVGAIAGAYADASFVFQGFLRAADGKFTTFEAPGAGTRPNQGISIWNAAPSIGAEGAITGAYLDGGNVFHGFLRTPHGKFIKFDVPGAASAANRGTIPQSINAAGVITGHYIDASGVTTHGFLLLPDCDDDREECEDSPLKANATTDDSAANSPQQALLSSVGPAAKLSATALSFGTVAIGTYSAAKTVTLTNAGTTAMTIGGIAVTGTNSRDFVQSHTCSGSLAAGASCTISVTFTPMASGTLAAALSVSDNATGSPQNVTLSGIGTTVRLSPASVFFRSVPIGTTSSPQTVTLTNVGTGSLSITAIAITGTDPADFAQTHTCRSLLAAGASCTISVTFKPTVFGWRTAALVITDSGAGSPQVVHLSGGCIPFGGFCNGRSSPCCPAPRGHFSYCSDPTGPGTCTES